MTGWQRLDEELAAWADAGREATFWWRDDDAVQVTPALQQLVELSENHADLPLAIATIPAALDASLSELITQHPSITLLQHGFCHTNHAPPSEKKQELGAHRPVAEVLADLTAGAELLRSSGASTLPVLVPPWNRIASDVARQLPDIGIKGLSTFRPRNLHDPIPGIAMVNTHADLVDWRGSRGFAGTDHVLDALIQHLTDRRTNAADPGEPTGLLTHHLVHDAECWQFLDELFSVTRHRPAVRWLSAAEAFDLADNPPALT